MEILNNVKLDRLEAWAARNSNWLALGVIAAAFVLRLIYADSCYLNADEAGHFDAARPSTWVETYRAAFVPAHPPLFILVLHAILFLGRSELVLRLPSVVGGTAALWLTFAWMRRSLGKIPALGGLGFMALCPAAISASTEVRQYGLLLCFVCGAVYATERTLADQSNVWAILQGVFLLGAVVTHYTATVVLLSLGAYVLFRSLLDGVPRRILFTIGVSYVLLLTLVGCLYFAHVRRSIPFGPGASMDYLRQFYYAGGRDTPLGFVWRSLSGTFLYLVGSRHLAFLSLFVFLAGLAALLTGQIKTGRDVTILIVSPFCAGFAAAVLQVFPFGGSRHQAYLLPFLAAGMSAAFLWFRRGLAAPLLLVGALLAPLWVIHAAPDNAIRFMRKGDMTAAIEYLRRTVPRGTPLFVDYYTRLLLTYYLGRDDPSLDTLNTLRSKPGVEECIGGYGVVEPRKFVWTFSPDTVLGQVAESARGLGVPSGDPLWVMSAAGLDSSPASRLWVGKEFGRVSVIKVSQ
jgi:hypothetical protein